MNEFLYKMKKNLAEVECEHLSNDKYPVTLLDKYILDQNGITVEEYITHVNPYCSIINHLAQVIKGDALYVSGMPEGEIIRVIMVVGHDESHKDIMWNMYSSEKTLYDEEYLMNQLLLYNGIKIVKNKFCLRTNTGPDFTETTY